MASVAAACSSQRISQPPPPPPQPLKQKKPYKELTLDGKVELIRLAEANPGLSQATIAERYGIAKSNVCRVLQRRVEYLRAAESTRFAGSRKRKLRGAIGTDDGSDLCKAVCNETLRAHMLKAHQISRMFMCRCCNFAYPDKTSLHLHMQGKQDKQIANAAVIGIGHPPVGVLEGYGDDECDEDEGGNVGGIGDEEAEMSAAHVGALATAAAAAANGSGGVIGGAFERNAAATPNGAAAAAAAAAFHNSLLSSAFGQMLNGGGGGGGNSPLVQQIAASRAPPPSFGGLHPIAAAMAAAASNATASAQSPQQQQSAQQLFHSLAAANPSLFAINNAVAANAGATSASALKAGAIFPQLSLIQSDSGDLISKLRQRLFLNSSGGDGNAASSNTNGGGWPTSGGGAHAAVGIDFALTEGAAAPHDAFQTTTDEQRRALGGGNDFLSMTTTENNNNNDDKCDQAAATVDTEPPHSTTAGEAVAIGEQRARKLQNTRAAHFAVGNLASLERAAAGLSPALMSSQSYVSGLMEMLQKTTAADESALWPAQQSAAVAAAAAAAAASNNNNSLFTNNNNETSAVAHTKLPASSTTKKSKKSNNSVLAYDAPSSAFSPTNTNSSASPSNGSSSALSNGAATTKAAAMAAAQLDDEKQRQQNEAELDAASVDVESVQGQNEFLMQKLLECRERVLAYMRAEQSEAVRAEFCHDLLKITFFN